jgi:hypothetical protein
VRQIPQASGRAVHRHRLSRYILVFQRQLGSPSRTVGRGKSAFIKASRPLNMRITDLS